MSLETATGRAASKPDLTFVILIHQSLRADAARLAANIAALNPDDRTDRVPGIQATTVSGPPCPSTPGQARVAVDEDEHGGSDRETGNNDHP
jgi:hypothetical protein